MQQQTFLELFELLSPLKKSLSANMNYRQLRFTYDDIIGFMDEKILHVFMKYQHLPAEEVKALAITSLMTLRARLYRKYGKEVNEETPDRFSAIEEEDYQAQLKHLIENLKPFLSPSQFSHAKLVLMPPIYVLTRVLDPEKRIPSHLFLEFLGLPTDPQSVKRFNQFRRGLFEFISLNFSRDTLEFEPKLLKNTALL